MMGYFVDNQVLVTPTVYTESYDANAQKVLTATTGTAFNAIVFNRSEATRYFSSTWGQDVEAVMVCDSDSWFSTTADIVTINSIAYKCDPPVDPGMNNLSGWDNVYTVGIRVHK